MALLKLLADWLSPGSNYRVSKAKVTCAGNGKAKANLSSGGGTLTIEQMPEDYAHVLLGGNSTSVVSKLLELNEIKSLEIKHEADAGVREVIKTVFKDFNQPGHTAATLKNNRSLHQLVLEGQYIFLSHI